MPGTKLLEVALLKCSNELIDMLELQQEGTNVGGGQMGGERMGNLGKVKGLHAAGAEDVSKHVVVVCERSVINHWVVSQMF